MTDSSNDDFSVNVEIKSKAYSIRVEKKTSLSNISSTVDKIINEILKSKSLSSTSTENVQNQNSSGLDLLSSRLGVDEKRLEDSKIFVLKGNNFNIINPKKLKPSEIGLLILAINEFVLGNSSISYENWKEKFENSNLKGKLKASEIVRDYKSYQRIEKSIYDNEKNLVLSAKGLDDLKSVITKSI